MTDITTTLDAFGIDPGDKDAYYACLNEKGKFTEEGTVALIPANSKQVQLISANHSKNESNDASILAVLVRVDESKTKKPRLQGEMKQSCMSVSFASIAAKSHKTQHPSRQR